MQAFSPVLRALAPTLLLATLPALAQPTPAAASSAPAPNLECSTDHAAAQALDDVLRAYERNDLNHLRDRLDPSLVGLQRFLDGVQQDFLRQKQLRLHLKDVQLQCGPDVTVIQASWEKRFIEVATFQPGLLTGRMAVLLHRQRERWQLAAVGGSSPFGSSAGGSAGELSAPATVSLTPLTVVAGAGAPAAAVDLPFPLQVTDADMAGRASVQVVLTTSQGDRETFTLAESAPGRFSRAALPLAAGAARAGDGTLQVDAGAVITVRYADLQPGNGRPASVLSQTVPTQGSPTLVDMLADPFCFVPVANAAWGASVVSNAVTVSGINRPTPIGVSGGSYAVNGGAFTSAPGTVSAGALVQVRVDAAATPSTLRSATLTIGGSSARFDVTTRAADITPDLFRFADLNNVAPGTPVSSAPIVVGGIDGPAPISVLGGSYAINGGPFTTAAGTVSNGQSVVLRVTSSSVTNGSGVARATLTIGGIAGSFTATTWDDQPNAFAWAPSLACGRDTVDSAPVTITGLTTAAPISVTSGAGSPPANAQYSINGGPFTSAPGSVSNGQTVTLRVAQFLTSTPSTVRATVSINGTIGTWSTYCP